MSKKKLKIFAYTATRSEYGLLFWLLKELNNDPEIDFCLIVSGTHLSKKFGYTYDVIKNDKWKKIKCIPSLTKKNNKFDNLISISKGTIGLSEFLTNENPDCIIVLGDRFELFSIMSVCTLLNIPIAHISGGEITEGANDNQIRNAMTKISHFHFVATEEYKKRVLQLGEESWRILKSGEIGLDNITNLELLSESELHLRLKIDLSKPTALIALHPITLEFNNLKSIVFSLLQALDNFNLQYIFTYPNIDSGSETIIKLFEEYVKNNPKNTILIKSLGQQNFLSLFKYVKMIIGNSSSGIVEAPSFNLPAINIGIRQKGRVFSNNIISCNYDISSIKEAINKGLNYKERPKANPYGNGNSSILVKNYLKKILIRKSKKEILQKKFIDYDIR